MISSVEDYSNGDGQTSNNYRYQPIDIDDSNIVDQTIINDNKNILAQKPFEYLNHLYGGLVGAVTSHSQTPSTIFSSSFLNQTSLTNNKNVGLYQSLLTTATSTSSGPYFISPNITKDVSNFIGESHFYLPTSMIASSSSSINNIGSSNTPGPTLGNKNDDDAYLDPNLKITLIVLLSLMIVCTVIGNILVCLSVILVRKLRHPSNYLLVSLAISDLCVAILVMPLALQYELSQSWRLSNGICDLWVSFDVTCCTSSILNLCTISIDRYLAITKPLTYGVRRTTKRILSFIVAVWIASCLISIPPVLILGNEHGTQDQPRCEVSQNLGYQLYATLGAFYIPLFVMIVMYYKIYVAAKRVVDAELRDQRPSCSSSMTLRTPTSNRFYSMRKPLKTTSENLDDQYPPSNIRLMDKNRNCLELNTVTNKTTRSEDAIQEHPNYSSKTPKGCGKKSRGQKLSAKSKRRKFCFTKDRCRQCCCCCCCCSTSAVNNNSECDSLEYLTISSNKKTQRRQQFEETTTTTTTTITTTTPATMIVNSDGMTTASTVVTTTVTMAGSGPTGAHNQSHKHLNGHQKLLMTQTSTISSASSNHHFGFRRNRRRSLASGSHNPNDSTILSCSSTLAMKQRASNALRERKASVTLGIIMTAFTVCWLPFFILAVLRPFSASVMQVPRYVNSIALWLGYANSMLNPIIYVTFHQDFRRAFKYLLCLQCRSMGTRLRTEAYLSQYGKSNLNQQHQREHRLNTNRVNSPSFDDSSIVMIHRTASSCFGGPIPNISADKNENNLETIIRPDPVLSLSSCEQQSRGFFSSESHHQNPRHQIDSPKVIMSIESASSTLPIIKETEFSAFVNPDSPLKDSNTFVEIGTNATSTTIVTNTTTTTNARIMNGTTNGGNESGQV